MLPINLVLSLIFGVGQLAIGVALLAYALRYKRWRALRTFGLALIGAWVVTSGAVELFVSGMEASGRLTGAPTPTVFTFWRGRADTLLFTVTALLAVLALAWPLALRIFARRGAGRSAG
ncbi:MAG: hypothetical protein ABI068_11675 [Ktedonobacterales bacterium]